MILSLTVPAMPLFHTDTGTLQSIDHPNSATGSLPLSLHCHQEQPHLQAIASQIMLHEEQTFLCLAVFCVSFPLNCNALKWCVWCLNVDLPVLFAKSSGLLTIDRSHVQCTQYLYSVPCVFQLTQVLVLDVVVTFRSRQTWDGHTPEPNSIEITVEFRFFLYLCTMYSSTPVLQYVIVPGTQVLECSMSYS